MTSESEKVLWQGQTIVLRPICDADDEQHKIFIAQLTPEDIRMRFFAFRKELSKLELSRLTHLDRSHEIAFIAERSETDPKSAETLGIVRAVSNEAAHETEIAIIVRSDLKRTGLGSLLLQKMLLYLSNHGAKLVTADVLRENTPMHLFLQAHGFKLDKLRTNKDALVFVCEL
jgi:acetyltransferase